MANLKAMHSISEVMQTPINSYVLIMRGEYLIPVLRATSSLKEKCTIPLKPNQQVDSVYKRVDVTECFVADYIHSDFSASKRCSFNTNGVYLLSTELKKLKKNQLTKITDKC